MDGGTTCGKGGPKFAVTDGPGGPFLRGDQKFRDRTRGPEDPRTRGPGTQGPRFLRAVLDCSSSNTTVQAINANATCLNHNYVLYVVAMHTEGVIYSRQRYSLTSLIFRVVYCQFCQARLAHRHDTQSERVWRRFAFDL